MRAWIGCFGRVAETRWADEPERVKTTSGQSRSSARLDAARAQGHDVTIVAAREETFSELNDAARRHGSAIHWISLGQLGTCIKLLQQAVQRAEWGFKLQLPWSESTPQSGASERTLQ